MHYILDVIVLAVLPEVALDVLQMFLRQLWKRILDSKI